MSQKLSEMANFPLTFNRSGKSVKPIVINTVTSKRERKHLYRIKIGSAYYLVMGVSENINGIRKLSCSDKKCHWRGKLKDTGNTKSEKRNFIIIEYTFTKKHSCVPETTEMAKMRAIVSDTKKSVSKYGKTVR